MLRSSLMKAGRSGYILAVARRASPTVRSIHAPTRMYSAASADSQYVTPSIRCRTPAIAFSSIRSWFSLIRCYANDITIEHFDFSSQAAGEQSVPYGGLELQLFPAKFHDLLRFNEPI